MRDIINLMPSRDREGYEYAAPRNMRIICMLEINGWLDLFVMSQFPLNDLEI